MTIFCDIFGGVKAINNEVLARVFGVHIATKEDIKDVRRQIKDLRHEIDVFRCDVDVKFAEFKADIITWMVGLTVAQDAFVFSLIKFLH